MDRFYVLRKGMPDCMDQRNHLVSSFLGGVGLAICLAISLAATGTDSAAAAARLDQSFAGRGFVYSPAELPPSTPPLGASTEVAEDKQGRLVVATGAGDGFLVVRYLPGGALDPSFGQGGRSLVQVGDPRRSDRVTVYTLGVQPDGKLLIAGAYDPRLLVSGGSGSSELLLARLHPNGTPDAGFGAGAGAGFGPDVGGVLIEARATRIETLALQGSSIVVGGRASAGVPTIIRYTAQGRLDRTFARGTGNAQFRRGKLGGSISGLIALKNGRILASGSLGGYFLLGRLHPNGVHDHRFRGAERLTNAAKRKRCGCSIAEGLARDSEGRLLLSGSLIRRQGTLGVSPSAIHPSGAFVVARFRADGNIDTSFGRRGFARVKIGSAANGRDVAVQPNGRVIVAGASIRAGESSGRFTAIRFRPNGGRDRSFFGNGVLSWRLGSEWIEGWDVSIDSSRHLLLAGSATYGASRSAGTHALLVMRLRPG